MKLFRGTKGGVTVFLTIILVPIIVICTIFIDVSRVYLAKDYAASSADLALNTVMSQFDVDLEQYYGMMASCQTIEESYDVAEQYFVACMQSQGVTATNAQEWASHLKGLLDETESFDDLLRIDQSESSADIQNIEDADMANPAMVKEQVTEFMKYRAPADLLGDAKDALAKGYLNKFKKVGEKVKNLPTEAIIQNKKNKYLTSENELLQKSLEAYEALENYEALKADDDYITKTKACYGALEGQFQDLHNQYIEYWANIDWLWSDGIEDVSTLVGTISGDSYEDGVDADTLCGLIGSYESAKTEYEKKRDEVAGKITTDAADYYNLSSPTVNEAQYLLHIEHVLSKGSGGSYSGSYYEEYISRYKDLQKALANLNAAYSVRDGRGTDDDVAGEDYEEGVSIDSKVTSINEEHSKADTGVITCENAKTIDDVTSKAKTYANHDNQKKYLSKSYADGHIRGTVQAGTQITDKESHLFAERYNFIYEANERIKKIKDLVEDMSPLADKYHTDYENWKNEVKDAEAKGLGKTEGGDEPDDSIIGQNIEEVNEIEGNHDDKNESVDYKKAVKIDIEGKDCDAFVERLENASALFDSYLKVAKSIKYHGACIMGTNLCERANNGAQGINNLDMFDNAAKTAGTGDKKVKNDDIPVKQSDLENYMESTWEFDGSDIDTLVELTNKNSPNFHNPQTEYTKESSIEKIDGFLHKHFDEFKTTDKTRSEKTKGMLATLKKLAKSPLPDDIKPYKNIHNSDNELNSLTDTPSKAGEGTSENTGDLVGKVEKDDEDVTAEADDVVTIADTLQGIAALLEDIGLAARDNLYTTDYIMNMFSYDTHYMETVYAQTRENMSDQEARQADIYNVGLDEKVKPGNASKLFDTVAAWNIMKNPDLTKTYNKSMTNKIICKMKGDKSDGELVQEFGGNNWAYGNEIEYILSGSTNETNKNRIGTVLYFIRYAFNFGPVFQEYYKKPAVNEIAEAIALATGGVMSPTLTKFIICMGMCAAESAVDELYLKAGLPVKLLKAKGELFILLDPEKDIAKMVKEEKGDDTIFALNSDSKVSENEISLSYSDYLCIFLYLEMIGNANNIYKRTADVIQANLSKNPNIDSYKESGFVMSKAKTYFTIDTKLKVKPMMITLPYAKEYGSGKLLEVDNWNTFTYKTVEGY